MKVLISGGGTGGHIYPAVAIAREIIKKYPEAHILFVGTEKGMEKDIVPKEGFNIVFINIRGFERKLSLSNIKTTVVALTSFFEVNKIINKFSPDVVIGTGGYVCGPVVMTAAIKGIPTLIHEQNAFPGITNRILSRLTTKIALTFEDAKKYFNCKKKLIVTGNPLREGFMKATKDQGLKESGFIEDIPIVLIVGGSRGAKRINESAIKLAKYCTDKKCLQLLHMTGQTQYENVLDEYKNNNIEIHNNKYIKVVPYIYNMPAALSACDIIISRSGAGTTTEITAMGKPAVLIPYPYATDNHQEYNARVLEKYGAAVVILERDLDKDILFDQIIRMISDKNRLHKMSNESKKLAKPFATADIVRIIEGLI